MGDSLGRTIAGHGRAALYLSLFTVAYNLAEGAASIYFASLRDSSALLGFGADSVVESFSGAVMAWRFWRPQGAPEREHRAARLVGLSLVVLAIYVVYESVASLWTSEQAEPSLAALIIATLSLIVMPTLYFWKRHIAQAIGSASLSADSKQTLACSMLSVALLMGAGLNYWAGWWQADPLAGLVIAAYLLWEGSHVLATREICEC